MFSYIDTEGETTNSKSCTIVGDNGRICSRGTYVIGKRKGVCGINVLEIVAEELSKMSGLSASTWVLDNKGTTKDEAEDNHI